MSKYFGKTLRWVAVLVMVAALVLSSAGPALAQDGKGAKDNKERGAGQVKAHLVTTMKRHLAVLARVIAGAPDQAKPALEAAREMTLKGFEATLDAVGLQDEKARLRQRSVAGSVESVNATAGEVTIAAREGAKVTVKVTATTSITVDEKAGTLADIKVGARVNARYNTSTGIASEVRVGMGEEGKRNKEREKDKDSKAGDEARASGTVGVVNAAAGEITISLEGGATITLKVAADTEVKVNGRKGTLADVKVGDRVRAEYDKETKVAEEIEVGAKAESKSRNAVSATGVLKAVDVAGNKVTVTVESGDLALKVVGHSKLIVGGVEVNLAGLALKVGAQVKVQYNDKSNTLITIEIAG